MISFFCSHNAQANGHPAQPLDDSKIPLGGASQSLINRAPLLEPLDILSGFVNLSVDDLLFELFFMHSANGLQP